jgi:thiol-disulfide isomerase/thioredoxin
MKKARTRLYAFAAGTAAVSVAAVLYGIYALSVHGASQPPPVLSRLKLTDGRPQVADVSFSDANGKQVKLADFRGRYVLLNLWATWCGPCIEELPSLAHLRTEVPQNQIAVIPVDMERLKTAQVEDFFARHGLHGLPIYIDKNYAVMRGFVANELPLTILIDAQGREVARAAGAEKWDDPASVAYLTKISGPKAQ